MPIEYPEYHRPHTRAQFEAFLSEAISPNARLGANSADTARRLSAYLAGRGSPERPVEVLMPRLEPGAASAGAVRPEVARILSGQRRYVLCIGTIEPRKNHLLLLALWRDLAREGLAPLLVLCGRRGWENEMVIDLLERCEAIGPHVAEFGDLSDREIDALLKGAAALLFPSFTEGLGLPLMEAGLAGTPAVVSDLPALREVAPPGTTFLHPLDGPAWRRAVLSLARPEGTAGGGQGT
jgi:glycosyltransferase involved in cell wall biosynthesis